MLKFRLQQSVGIYSRFIKFSVLMKIRYFHELNFNLFVKWNYNINKLC